MTRSRLAATVLTVSLVVGTGVDAGEIRGRVVTTEGMGIVGAVVFVRSPVSPAAAAGTPAPSAVMDQVDKQFVPHVLPIAVGTEVRFPNHDQIHHHVYSFSRVKSFDLPLSKGEEAAPVLFETPGVVKVGCNIHDWMMGVILVVPTPYFTVTDDGGAFVLRNIPAGEVTVTAWHEASETSIDTATQHVTPDERGVPDLTFTLVVRPDRTRPGTHGSRGNP